jgi:hypothetical protein
MNPISSPGEASVPAGTDNSRRWRRVRAWTLGVLILAGFIGASTHWTELEHFAELVRRAKPVWLLAAVALQGATYFLAASVWYVTLRAAGARQKYLPLVPLGLAKLFSDQAVPSGGFSGNAFFVTALVRRGLPKELCMAALLVSIVAYHGAYLASAIASVFLLALYHTIHVSVVVLSAVFTLFCVAVPAGALFLHKLTAQRVPARLARLPFVASALTALSDAPVHLVRNPGLVAVATVLQGAIFVSDAATLYVLLHAIGQPVSLFVAFPSFIVACMAATLGLVPLGLGTFETTGVLMLNSLGVELEAALTGILLLRGFTLWLPMLPGLWLTRRELA